MAGGRPSIYSEELAHEICKRIAYGETLKKICSEDAMPEYSTVLRWKVSNEAFFKLYTLARQDQADTLVDEILEISDDSRFDWGENKEGQPVLNTEHVQRSRLRVDTRKWIAAKVLPKVYGDRVHQEVTGAEGGPVQISNILEQCRQRAKEG